MGAAADTRSRGLAVYSSPSVSSTGWPSCPCGPVPQVKAERTQQPPALQGGGRLRARNSALLMSARIRSCLAVPLVLSLHFSETGGGRESTGVPPLFTGGDIQCGLQGPAPGSNPGPLPLPSYTTQASP